MSYGGISGEAYRDAQIVNFIDVHLGTSKF